MRFKSPQYSISSLMRSQKYVACSFYIKWIWYFNTIPIHPLIPILCTWQNRCPLVIQILNEWAMCCNCVANTTYGRAVSVEWSFLGKSPNTKYVDTYKLEVPECFVWECGSRAICKCDKNNDDGTKANSRWNSRMLNSYMYADFPFLFTSASDCVRFPAPR